MRSTSRRPEPLAHWPHGSTPGARTGTIRAQLISIPLDWLVPRTGWSCAYRGTGPGEPALDELFAHALYDPVLQGSEHPLDRA